MRHMLGGRARIDRSRLGIRRDCTSLNWRRWWLSNKRFDHQTPRSKKFLLYYSVCNDLGLSSTNNKYMGRK